MERVLLAAHGAGRDSAMKILFTKGSSKILSLKSSRLKKKKKSRLFLRTYTILGGATHMRPSKKKKKPAPTETNCSDTLSSGRDHRILFFPFAFCCWCATCAHPRPAMTDIDASACTHGDRATLRLRLWQKRGSRRGGDPGAASLEVLFFVPRDITIVFTSRQRQTT